MKSLGICIGASTLSAVEAEIAPSGRIEIKPLINIAHNGNPREVILQVLDDIPLDEGSKVAVTGRTLRQAVKLSTISEPDAVESALHYLNGSGRGIDAVVSAGGENFLVYILGKDGRICAVKTGNKCASGTGEFFLQQLRRIDLSLDEAMSFAREESPYRVSGRCSVFCKSDCTHATNKGIPKGRIVSGLCEMIAGKILEVIRQTPGSRRIMLIGGLARNQVVIDYLKGKIEELQVPREAPYFEALGAAVWALQNETMPVAVGRKIFKDVGHSFTYLTPLRNFQERVEFKELDRGEARAGDDCLLGLDVGSTTTKAVLVRMADDKILNSIYLRTNGNPVEASRACFTSLHEQLGNLADKIAIRGVGVTGSGRQIAGLYAMTEGVVNEIIAHATGALFFDAAVDTIFEIGGQDAKYTYVHQGMPSDYAMNDACSAGTGSFLEEVAREAMDVEMDAIGPLALKGERPPNFNDQCSAFISSDIKNAFQEGLTKEDILAGLVYSICMNYNNRVKGNRPVGRKVFMQGGVCYNQAVPMAMAALTGKSIVVPPEPGLVGAFGVALEVKRRLKIGTLTEGSFSLRALKERTFEQRQPFICDGGKSGCDRKCEITRIRVEGKTHPFGGACNRWYNVRSQIEVDADKLDLVKKYERLVFPDDPPGEGTESGPRTLTVGVNKSFFVNTYYPLYRHFFQLLGFKVQLPAAMDAEGVDYRGAAFCYPAEIAHGYFLNLLNKRPDYLFLPHLKGLSLEGDDRPGTTCPFSQGEPYFLATAFKENEIMAGLQRQGRILKPVLDFTGDHGRAAESMARSVKVLGVGRRKALAAYEEARRIQDTLAEEMKKSCSQLLQELEQDRSRMAIVVVGRSYNAFVAEANKGIPQKIASRGVPVLPFAFLPYTNEEVSEEMYWAAGQMILKSSRFIARHPQLFPCYITNFSCGPDSFLLEYFRHIMGKKPFLILELDSHVADAGLETRIEAFLDIINNYRELDRQGKTLSVRSAPGFLPARFDNLEHVYCDSRGRKRDLYDPSINVLIPSMGKLGNKAVAAVFRSAGIRATALPPADEETLKLGRSNTSCKECLPLLLTVGALLKYLQEGRKNGDLLLYFMPTASGPCRFGQYSFFIRHMIGQLGIEDVALFSLQAENGYRDLGGKDFFLKLWSSTIIADIFQDLYSLLLTNAVDKNEALRIYWGEWEKITKVLAEAPDFRNLKAALRKTAGTIRGIEGVKPWSEVPVVMLTGEIFVRHDDLSRQFLVEKLADEGLAVKTAGVMEWVYYTDYCYSNNLAGCQPAGRERPALFLKSLWMQGYERAYKRIIAGSGLLPFHWDNVPHMIRSAADLISPQLTGEAILTVGGAITEVPRHYCGVISIGPFGCMPNRLSEAILSKEMGQGWQSMAGRGKGVSRYLKENIYELPFLAIESDGNPFPQVIRAKMEVFLSQALRLHQARQNRR